jgi:histone chaperone ASF1
MVQIRVNSVKIINNPCAIGQPIELEIEFMCHAPGLNEDLEWQLVYVINGKDDVLDSVIVGPVSIGLNKFSFSAPAPSLDNVPNSDLMDMSAVILSAFYRNVEFIRVGYYVKNEYPDSEMHLKTRMEEAKQLQIEAIERHEEERAREEISELYCNELFLPPLPFIHLEKLWRNILTKDVRVTHFSINWD